MLHFGIRVGAGNLLGHFGWGSVLVRGRPGSGAQPVDPGRLERIVNDFEKRAVGGRK